MRFTRREMLQAAARLGSMGALVSARGGWPAEGGPFTSDWASLKQYRCPEWFRDAKLGIWAVWGPESVPQQGDWYARNMYREGEPQYQYHLQHYGHPSKFGYKDIIPLWKAERWDPEHMMGLYKKAGAKYFCVIAEHHDNFDCWNSKFQRWNSANMGPKKDVVGIWARTARSHGVRFGVTEHLGATWNWWVVNKGADKQGPYAGVPYDGNDPQYQDLYLPPHEDSKEWYSTKAPEWWQRRWFNRIQDLVDSYQPDLLYSDGGIPFYEVGRSLVAHFYNTNMQKHGGKLEAVYNCKKMPDYFEEGTCVEDVERGVMQGINPIPWQTDTCIGDWYYKQGIKYKSATTVVTMLADIVSKNGNLLLNIPPRPDGSLDDEELAILGQLAAWMEINADAIFGTRPWKVFGEGPTHAKAGKFGEENEKSYTADDIRFTMKGETLFAIALAWPEKGRLDVKSLGTDAGLLPQDPAEVRLLGHPVPLKFHRERQALVVDLPGNKPCEHAYVLRIT
jgi:alpha-L-fucosidase